MELGLGTLIEETRRDICCKKNIASEYLVRDYEVVK